MAHPLNGAGLKLVRADRHLAEAQSLINQWSLAVENNIVSNDNYQTISFGKWPDLPPELSVVVSDAIHNLRSALDYVVYELALLDSGKVQYGTQFPIEDFQVDPVNPKRGFNARIGTYLKGLNSRHVDIIEGLQPYKGVEWTKTLRDISNPDKHRKLTHISYEGRQAAVRLDYTPNGKYRGAEKMTPDGPIFDSYNLKFEGHYAIAIATGDPSEPPLMVTLRRLESAVSSTITLFEPDFPI